MKALNLFGWIRDNMFERKQRNIGLRNRLTSRNSFLHSIGFEIPFIIGHSRKLRERPKSIIQTSRRLSLARSGVHILPSAISITIICLNISHLYLGRTLPGSIVNQSIDVALLQVAAKVQELLVVASMTTIVIHVIRQELCAGASVPLGMIGGGFLFTSLAYFWSPELWGSFGAKCSWSTRSRLFGILFVGGVVAALAGPASAVLLIPKQQQWTAGGTKFYLPGSFESWWPVLLNGTETYGESQCSTGPLPDRGICSTGGYTSFWNARDRLDIFGKPAYPEGSRNNATTNLVFGPQGVDIANDFRLLPAMRYSGSYRGFACETAVVGIRTAEAIYQQQLLQDWRMEVMSIPWAATGKTSALSEYKYYTSLTATTRSQVPTVRVACTPAQAILETDRNIHFPVLNPEGCSGKSTVTTSTSVPNLIDSSTQMSFTWITLPETFGTTSAGIVVSLPRRSSTDTRVVVGCSVDARWTNGTIVTSDLRMFATSSNLFENFKATQKLDPALHGPPTAIGQPNYSEFRPVILNTASRRIILKSGWLYNISTADDAATDSAWTANNLGRFTQGLSLADGLAQRTTDQAEFWNSGTSGLVNRTVALEWSLALVITDAISRIGSQLVLNSTGPASIWSLNLYNKTSDFRTQILQNKGIGSALIRPTAGPIIDEDIVVSIGGYSYAATSITDYASIALLMLHLVLALCHVLYTVCYTSQSSSAWDTLTELMVLMQNSRPANRSLRNANAGIKETRTYGVAGRLCTTAISKTNQKSKNRSATKANVKQGGGIKEPRNVELIFEEWSKPPGTSKLEGRAGSDLPRNVLRHGVQPDFEYGYPLLPEPLSVPSKSDVKCANPRKIPQSKPTSSQNRDRSQHITKGSRQS